MNTNDPTSAFETIDQVIRAARNSLEPAVHEWVAVGAGQGVTVSRNVNALNELALVPRVGRDVADTDTSTRFAGIDLAVPVFLAPVAALGMMDPGDAEAAARAASRSATVAFCPILTTSKWGDVAETAPGRHVFQIYTFGDRKWLADLVDEVQELGFAALCVTLDSAVIGRRDGSIESGYIWRAPDHGSVNLAERGWDPSYRTSFTWGDFEWLCERAELDVIAKGIMHPEDAQRAVDGGASAVYVSNHGGRMVDHGLSTIEALSGIVEAVGEQVDVGIDGGFTRGAEVLTALALGADAIGIGRLQCWAMAAGGEECLDTTLRILASEIALTMASLGCSQLSDLNPSHVRPSISAPPIHS